MTAPPPPAPEAASAPPDVAVIIPHHEDAARLRRCLEALTADPDAAAAEIVVVDNASRCDVVGAIAGLPGVRLVVETRRGAAFARNRGAAETRAPRLFFLDCDCVPLPGWIAEGRAALDRAEVVGGAVEVFEETPPPRSGAEAVEAVFAFDQKTYVERKGFSVSANLLTWRRVFDEVGGFAPGLSEDVDWCRRAVAAGHALVYEPALRVRHPARADWPQLTRKFRRVTAEMYALNGRTARARLRWGARALAMIASPWAHLPRLLASPRLDGAGERLRGGAALVGLRTLRGWWMLRQAFTDRP